MVDESATPRLPQPLWLPYAQMKLAPELLEVVSAEGVRLGLADGRELIDAVSSWWSVVHGYNHPSITAAALEQMQRAPHVMMGGLLHEKTRELAEQLVRWTPEPLGHVFFGDSGSVGVEIALKMAVQFWLNQGKPEKHRMLALKKAYHGDTCGAMSVCDPEDGMHSRFAGLLPRQLFLPAPSGGFAADEARLGADLEDLERALSQHHHELAGFIVEPILQAAGGFHLYSAAYLRAARQLCDRYGVLLIFDEVATGFGRLGARFAAELAGVCPDIMVLGKAMTAGYFGHSATLTTPRVFNAFFGDERGLAFMHGPTFMGNATSCAVALAGMRLFEAEDYLGKIARIEAQLQAGLQGLSGPSVQDVRVLGAMAVVEARDRSDLVGLQGFAADRGVWLRPFERFAYTMPPYVIGQEDLGQVVDVLRQWFER
jgi:adenosylmethionine-8-amino-7-oxononanoate aminotransferase